MEAVRWQEATGIGGKGGTIGTAESGGTGNASAMNVYSNKITSKSPLSLSSVPGPPSREPAVSGWARPLNPSKRPQHRQESGDRRACSPGNSILLYSPGSCRCFRLLLLPHGAGHRHHHRHHGGLPRRLRSENTAAASSPETDADGCRHRRRPTQPTAQPSPQPLPLLFHHHHHLRCPLPLRRRDRRRSASPGIRKKQAVPRQPRGERPHRRLMAPFVRTLTPPLPSAHGPRTMDPAPPLPPSGAAAARPFSLAGGG